MGLYAVLGLSPGASTKDIEKKYKELSEQLSLTKAVEHAYKALTDVTNRERELYDRQVKMRQEMDLFRGEENIKPEKNGRVIIPLFFKQKKRNKAQLELIEKFNTWVVNLYMPTGHELEKLAVAIKQLRISRLDEIGSMLFKLAKIYDNKKIPCSYFEEVGPTIQAVLMQPMAWEFEKTKAWYHIDLYIQGLQQLESTQERKDKIFVLKQIQHTIKYELGYFPLKEIINRVNVNQASLLQKGGLWFEAGSSEEMLLIIRLAEDGYGVTHIKEEARKVLFDEDKIVTPSYCVTVKSPTF